MKPEISVIVVNLNRRELLGRCLASLWRQTFSNFEVVVVDNGSTDGSMEFLRAISDPRLRIVSLPSNKGFAGGSNAGITVAKGRYIATLNNDAEADQRWLEELAVGIESDESVGMCASKILEYFFAYGDDADLGLRGRLAGWKCLYIPTAVVYHVHSATAGEFSPLKAFLIERNRICVAVKIFPFSLLLISPFFTAVRLAYHAYGSIFMIGSSGQYAAECSHTRLALMMLKAYWSGLKLFPEMWRSRRKIRRFARLTDRDFAALLRRHRISLRALTLGT